MTEGYFASLLNKLTSIFLCIYTPYKTGDHQMRYLVTTVFLVLTFVSSSSLAGSCISGDCRNGYGTSTYSNGSKYEGNFQNGGKGGKGTYYYIDGGTYVGEWKNDKKDGFGTATYSDGGRYIGEFRDDKKAGRGKETFANGGSYEGDWKNNLKHGHGTENWPNGNSYIGGFRDNLLHGDAVYTLANGTKLRQVWNSDKRVSSETINQFDSSETHLALPDYQQDSPKVEPPSSGQRWSKPAAGVVPAETLQGNTGETTTSPSKSAARKRWGTTN
jgi:hypothetical protein